jgi:hypothetical protein
MPLESYLVLDGFFNALSVRTLHPSVEDLAGYDRGIPANRSAQ